MMGSRRRVTQVKHSVLENGANPQVISQLHSPIGLDIKAETPEEIKGFDRLDYRFSPEMSSEDTYIFLKAEK